MATVPNTPGARPAVNALPPMNLVIMQMLLTTIMIARLMSGYSRLMISTGMHAVVGRLLAIAVRTSNALRMCINGAKTRGRIGLHVVDVDAVRRKRNLWCWRRSWSLWWWDSELRICPTKKSSYWWKCLCDVMNTNAVRFYVVCVSFKIKFHLKINCWYKMQGC